jgi:hypothetical protein
MSASLSSISTAHFYSSFEAMAVKVKESILVMMGDWYANLMMDLSVV